MSLNEHFTPAFLKVKRGKTVTRGTFRWVDPQPRFRGTAGQAPGVTTRGDRFIGDCLIFAATAQAKGWETTVSWTTPRSRKRVTVPPFRSPDHARAYLEELQDDPFMGHPARRALEHVRDYLAVKSITEE